MEKEKIAKRQQKDRFPGFGRLGETIKQYSTSESNNNMIKFAPKSSHYKFVVDWQLNNDSKTIVE
jgi:hypothetical protein